MREARTSACPTLSLRKSVASTVSADDVPSFIGNFAFGALAGRDGGFGRSIEEQLCRGSAELSINLTTWLLAGGGRLDWPAPRWRRVDLGRKDGRTRRRAILSRAKGLEHALGNPTSRRSENGRGNWLVSRRLSRRRSASAVRVQRAGRPAEAGCHRREHPQKRRARERGAIAHDERGSMGMRCPRRKREHARA